MNHTTAVRATVMRPEPKRAAMARLREAGFVFHGLRKNAVNMLLETGCTEAAVSAIVEMSEQMVRHYARDVNKRRLARNAMRKLEEGWAETRKNLFGTGSAIRDQHEFGNRLTETGNRHR